MADNIFDAERNRRIQHLQQQSVSNVIRINPALRSVLSRYEDAEVSRLKLLELQRLRNKKITAGEKALLKGIVKGRTTKKGRATKEKIVAEPQKSQTQIEVEAEERRRKLAQQDRFLELEDFRQQREFIANERKIQLGDIRRQTEFISGQNRIAADQQIAAFNQQQANIRAGQSRQLEERKLQAQLQDIRERVARDDAFRHAQLQEQQRLALEQLAAQRLDNSERILLEQRRIDNQRAVDAEKAITDRELIQTLQASIDRLNRTQESQESQEIRPEQKTAIAEQRSIASSESGFSAETPLSNIEQTGSEIAAEAQRGAVSAGLRPSAEESLTLQQASSAGSSSSSSSSSSEEVFLSEREKRTEDIRKGKTLAERKAQGTPTFITKTGEERAKFGEGQREAAKQRAAERKRRAAEAGVLQEQAADTSLRETKPQPEPEPEPEGRD